DSANGTAAFARRVTFLATEADGELWAPDGKHLLFASNVYPACDDLPEAEANCNEQKLKEVEQSKVKAMISDRLLYRHWNAYKEGKRSHIFVMAAEGPRFVKDYSGPHVDEHPRDLTPGDYDAPVFSLGGQDNYAFSPDGNEICYSSNHDKNEAASTNNALWIVPVQVAADASSGQVLAQTKNITADNPASDSTPLYSPDGRYIAYRAQQRPGYESDRFRLMLYDRKTGEKKNLTESFDHWVGDFAWGPHSSSIYFAAENSGESWIYQRMLDGTNWKRTSGYHKDSDILELIKGFNGDPTVSAVGEKLLFTRMSLEGPTEIRSLTIDSCFYAPPICDGPGFPEFPLGKDDSQAITHINDAVLSQVSMSPLEPFWFTGAHNDKVEGFLVK